MKIKHRYNPNSSTEVVIEEPEICPICKTAIKPYELSNSDYRNNKGEYFFTIMSLCKHCYMSFISLYLLLEDSSGRVTASKLIYTEPNRYVKEVFKEDINELSPTFIKIYNEASQAETLNMTEIAGIGYRKAFEFLIKDFFIKLNPAEEAKKEIIDTSLSNFFSNKNPSKYKLENPKLNDLALASVWIGNDFAHYYQQHEEYNLDDFKELIEATLNQISIELFTLAKARKILSEGK